MPQHYIFPSVFALPAFKNGPYKNTAHAVAELIDNSADADAEDCGVVIFVEENNPTPIMIAALDNGVGMDEDRLAICLQYGYGQEADQTKERRLGGYASRKRLGKFGVGLLSASFSQCTDVEVMSWQESQPMRGENIPSVRLTSNEDDESAQQNRIPDVTHESLPEWTNDAFVGMSRHISQMRSGTLVIWRGLNPSWKRSKTLQENLLRLCGRIHREYIRLKLMSINVIVYNLSTQQTEGSKQARAIDPSFLHNWDATELKNYGFVGKKTLFLPFTGHKGDLGENSEGKYVGETRVVHDPNGQEVGKYVLLASCRSKEVLTDEELKRQWDDPGDAPYGKLARELQGVSILRSSREIALDDGWLRTSRTVDRWVSVCIDFDPSLDDVVGISNDKQQVRSLSEFASKSVDDIKNEMKAVRNDAHIDDWEYLARLGIALHIKQRLGEMQRFVQKQRSGVRVDKARSANSLDPTYAPISELRVDGDKVLEGDREIEADRHSPSEDEEGTAQVYGNSMSGDKPAKEVRPEDVIRNDLNIDYVRDPLAPPTRMFHHSVGIGHMVVHFHEKHPLSDVLSNLLWANSEFADGEDKPPATMQDALRVIRSLVASYARVQAEAEEYDVNEAEQLERTLLSWSKKASYMYRDRED